MVRKRRSYDPIPWPPRSPDITSLDFFLWGYVKNSVYKSRVKSIIDLKTRIDNVVSSVNEDMFKNMREELQMSLQRTARTLNFIKLGFFVCY